RRVDVEDRHLGPSGDEAARRLGPDPSRGARDQDDAVAQLVALGPHGATSGGRRTPGLDGWRVALIVFLLDSGRGARSSQRTSMVARAAMELSAPTYSTARTRPRRRSRTTMPARPSLPVRTRRRPRRIVASATVFRTSAEF